MSVLIFLLPACLLTMDHSPSYMKGDTIPIKMSFENEKPGTYTDHNINKSWPNVQWSNVYHRIKVTKRPSEAQSQCIRVYYPEGSVGPSEGGAQFLVNLPARNEYFLSYQIRFGKNFDFRKGGKLPGLTSGGSKYTGGKVPVEGDGWSARYMWKNNGELIIYFYYVDMPGQYGENLSLNFSAEKEKWYKLTQRIKINDPGKTNGILEVWIDDKKVLSRNNIRFRIGEKGKIDSFYFSTFHGGNNKSWAPLNDSYLFFDQFYISEEYH